MAVTNLDEERASRFLRLLADEPFVCLVDTGDELRIFSKGIDGEKLDRIKTMLVTSETESEGKG